MSKTQFRVVNANSGEALTEWMESNIEVHLLAAECEQHETQPECRVERRKIDDEVDAD